MTRRAQKREFEEVQHFYWTIAKRMETSPYDVLWRKGIYPSDEFISSSIEEGALFIEEEAGLITGAMILNHCANEGYRSAHWLTGAADLETLFIHALGVHPDRMGRGIGRRLLDYAVELAGEEDLKSVRLDVIPHNTPARHLYEKRGFINTDKVTMYYEDTGWMEFLLYELPLIKVIRKAVEADIPKIERIYSAILDLEEAGAATTGWIRGVYPTEETAWEALRRGDLFTLTDRGEVRAAARINREEVDVYAKAPWKYEGDDVMVLHTLTVDPMCKGKGYGSAFVSFYEKYAKAHGCNTLRMDTNERNSAARRLYAHLGYREAGVLPCTFNGIEGVGLVCIEKRL